MSNRQQQQQTKVKRLIRMTSTIIKLLTLLQQYETLHTTANDNLKSCIWNITKGRKVGTSQSCYGSLQYSVDNVREELRAMALLEHIKVDTSDVDVEPSLVSEESSLSVDTADDKDDEVSKGSKFVLHLDGMRNAKFELLAAARVEAQEQTNSINITILDNNNANEGLRIRHQSTATTTTQDDNIDKKSNEWTTELLDAPTPLNNNNEEERLQQQQYTTDPLNLFGIPPPALRVAQSKSRCAIAYYVGVVIWHVILLG